MSSSYLDYQWAIVGCPRNEKKNFSVRTETNRNKICFAFVSVRFVKPKIFLFRLFRCFEPVSKQPKQTEQFRNEPKQSGIFWKISTFCKVWWRLPLFLFILSFSYIHNHIHTVHSFISICRGSFPFLHCLLAQREKPSRDAEPRFELGPAIR